MSNNNTAKVVFTFTADEVKWDFNEAAKQRFGKGTGQRHNVGAGYFLASKEDREKFVAFLGQGVVRRGLLVLAKGRHTSEADAMKATALAETLRTARATAAAA